MAAETDGGGTGGVVDLNLKLGEEIKLPGRQLLPPVCVVVSVNQQEGGAAAKVDGSIFSWEVTGNTLYINRPQHYD